MIRVDPGTNRITARIGLGDLAADGMVVSRGLWVAVPPSAYRARSLSEDGVQGCAGERLRSRSREEHAVRDRRQGGRPRLGRRLRRPGGGWGCRARARGRGGDREVDALARGRRAARARAGCACSRRGRPRPSAASRTSGWATCSRTSSTTSLPSLSTPRRRALEVALLRRGGRRTIPSITARSAWRCATCCSCSASGGRSCSRSTTFSGSTRPRRARSRSRCDGSRRARCSCCSPGGSSTEREPSGLEQALDAERVERLPVGPLSVGALHRLLHDRLGRPFARQTLLRIHERSGGNPFFALELARVLDEDVDPLEPLPVPETLDELVRARLAGLPAVDARRARARLGAGDAVGVAPGAGGRCGRTRSTPAVAAHVIERENGAIRFTHPLLSSVLYRDLGRAATERPRADRRASSTTRSSAPVTSRSRATRPTPTIAAALDDAATARGRPRRSGRRGRARRAGASADAAGRGRRAPSAGAGCRSRASRRRGVDARPDDCERPAGRERTSGRCAPRRSSSSPSSRASTGPSRCSRRRCARRRRGPRCRRSSTAGSRGRRASRRDSTARSSTRERRSSSPTISTTTRSGSTRSRCSTFLGCAVGDPEAPAHAARAHELAAAVGDARLLNEANDAIATVLDVRRSVDEARALLEREYEEWHERDELLARGRAHRARLGRALGRPLAARGRVRRSRHTTSTSSTGSRCRGSICRSR